MNGDNVQQGQLHAKGLEFTNIEKKQRLDQLDERISRKNATLKEAIGERLKIMARSIRRMRRAAGKIYNLSPLMARPNDFANHVF